MTSVDPRAGDTIIMRQALSSPSRGSGKQDRDRLDQVVLENNNERLKRPLERHLIII
ncbi:MAG: hypothetical protein ACE5JL_05245 [Dehalococcoidia bacterium]